MRGVTSLASSSVLFTKRALLPPRLSYCASQRFSFSSSTPTHRDNEAIAPSNHAGLEADQETFAEHEEQQQHVMVDDDYHHHQQHHHQHHRGDETDAAPFMDYDDEMGALRYHQEPQDRRPQWLIERMASLEHIGDVPAILADWHRLVKQAGILDALGAEEMMVVFDFFSQYSSKAAAQMADLVLENEPSMMRLSEGLVMRAHALIGDPSKAVEAYKKYYAKSDDPDMHITAAMAEVRLKRPVSKIVELVEIACEMKPQNAAMYFQLMLARMRGTRGHRTKECLQVIEHMLKEDIDIGAMAWGIFLDCAGTLKQWSLVESHLQHIDAHCAPPPDKWKAAVKHFATHQHGAVADRIIDLMVKAFPHDPGLDRLYAELFHRYCTTRKGDAPTEEAAKFLDDVLPDDSLRVERFLSDVLTISARSRNMAIVATVLKYAQDVNASLSPSSVGQIVVLEARSGDIAKVIRWLERIGEMGIDVDATAWGGVVNVYVNNNMYDKAIEIIKGMKGQGIRPNPSTYHYLVDRLHEKQLFDKEIMLWEMMLWDPSYSVSFVNQMWNKALRACFAARNSDMAMNIYQEMMDRNVRIDQVGATTLIAGFADCHYHARVWEVVDVMLQRRIRPNEVTYRALRNYCYAYGYESRLEELYPWFKENGVVVKDHWRDESLDPRNQHLSEILYPK